MHPLFPEFKTIEITDRMYLEEILWQYRPHTSELTFTNLFIWRTHYGLQWSRYQDWLLLICKNVDDIYALQPIGPSPRHEVATMLLKWLKEEKMAKQPRIERADTRFVSELMGIKDFTIAPTPDQFDYVYRTEDLIYLSGNNYLAKRNHINNFISTHSFMYDKMDENYLRSCLELTEKWCGFHRCEDDMNLLDEWEAVGEALANFNDLKMMGGVILIEDKVEAFALGESLNDKTAVIHIEKANPEISGLYAVINQKFVEHAWRNIPYINREQDLGIEGLRKAKQSYHPDHLVEKFRIVLDGGR